MPSHFTSSTHKSGPFPPNETLCNDTISQSRCCFCPTLTYTPDEYFPLHLKSNVSRLHTNLTPPPSQECRTCRSPAHWCALSSWVVPPWSGHLACVSGRSVPCWLPAWCTCWPVSIINKVHKWKTGSSTTRAKNSPPAEACVLESSWSRSFVLSTMGSSLKNIFLGILKCYCLNETLCVFFFEGHLY